MDGSQSDSIRIRKVVHGHRCFGLSKAADLFFGILIVVSSLLLGQKLSVCGCPTKPQVECRF